MNISRMLVFTGFLFAALAKPFVRTGEVFFEFVSGQLISFYRPDMPIEQRLTELIQAMLLFFGDQWRRAEAFIALALMRKGYSGDQFSDTATPSLRC